MNHHTTPEKIQESIYQISEAAMEATSLQELFLSIHKTIGQLLPATNFYIALVEPETKLLHFSFWVDEFDPQPTPRKLGKGLTEFVLRTAEAQLIPSERFEELVNKGEVQQVGSPSIDWLGVPLKIRENTIGVLVLQSYTEGVRYDEDDKEMLRFVSNQIAMAIERKRTEDKLRESEAKFRSLFNHVYDGVYQTTPEGNIVTANPALVRMLGYDSEEDFLGVNVGADLYINPDEREYWSKVLDEKGVIRNAELHLRKKNGEQIVALENAYAVRDANGKLLYQEGTLTDITELKQYEEELEVQRAYFEQLYQSAPEAIVILDNEDRVLRINREFARMFGYSQEEIAQQPINEIIVPESMRNESIFLTQTVAQGQVVSAEAVRKRKDGEFIHVSILGTPILTENGQVGVYGIYRDITERKHREVERERLLNEIQDALGKVKTLSGLLPICANCKKVRDDNGYWNQIEVYISEHSSADFTHGICPDCSKNLYGDKLKKK
ncbi:MAG: PAS domain S-box protein [Ignavibacteriae bacterium]|nr:PAS domain S-box protein [Ignavibacteriota bacterium]